VSEKAAAFAEAAMTLATGGSAHDVVRGYRDTLRGPRGGAQRERGC
jgi:hypothetical protein